MDRLAGWSIPVGLVGLFVAHWWIFGLLTIFGIAWTLVSWARTETRVAPNTAGAPKADDLRRADDEDATPVFGDAVAKSGGLGACSARALQGPVLRHGCN